MSTETNVYVSALQDSLRKKQKVLQEILTLTKEQESLLAQEHPNMDRFEEIMGQKEGLIRSLHELDQGFEALFQKIGDTLQKQRHQYEKPVRQMQERIRAITDLGVQIEGVERRNRDAFQKYLVNERKGIRTGLVSSRTAVSYYQNMPNQHHDWQSYFLDQKQ